MLDTIFRVTYGGVEHPTVIINIIICQTLSEMSEKKIWKLTA